MGKLFGYIVALVGLVILIFSSKISKISVFSGIKPAYILIFSLIVVIIGVAFSLGKSREKQVSKEVPIYHGKKIVGYSKEK